METSHQSVSHTFKNLIEKTGLNEDQLKPLAFPARIITFHIPFAKDDGNIEIIEGWRVQYNDTLGPTKGGLRYHPGVNEEEVTELAYLMTLKTSLVGLPYGGGKGGLKIDPKDYSKEELERLSKQWMRSMAHHIGPHKDVPAPDVNTTPEIMKWLHSEYEKVTGNKSPAVITGKPVEDGGSLGRTEATGRGGFLVLREYAKDKDWDPSETKIAIQGFGNVGYYFAKLADEYGFKIVAVSDSSGGIHDDNGLDISKVIAFKDARGRFKDFDGAELISNEDLLELDVDVLAPAALGDVITEKNVDDIKAELILELANGPVSPGADDVLNQKNIPVIPGILANSGGVIVSYYEWKQNIDGESWAEDILNEKLEEQIIGAYKKVSEAVVEKSVDWRTAANYVAVTRILD